MTPTKATTVQGDLPPAEREARIQVEKAQRRQTTTDRVKQEYKAEYDDQIEDYEKQKELPTTDNLAYQKLKDYATMDPADRTPAMMKTINKMIKHLGQAHGITDLRYITRNMNENQIRDLINTTQQRIASVKRGASKLQKQFRQTKRLNDEINRRIEAKAAKAAAKADATTAATRATGFMIANQQRKAEAATAAAAGGAAGGGGVAAPVVATPAAAPAAAPAAKPPSPAKPAAPAAAPAEPVLIPAVAPVAATPAAAPPAAAGGGGDAGRAVDIAPKLLFNTRCF